MDEPLPPDPYVTLGVPRDTPENEIKSAYKKLALKCHPDKFLDADIKKAKEEEFHQLNQAYELLCDPEKKSEWEATVKLAEMRKQAMQNAASPNLRRSQTDMPPGSYKTRTAAPSFATPTPSREEPSRRSYDETYSTKFDTYPKSRKHDDFRSEKRSAPRTEEKAAKVASDRKRAEARKDKDKAEKGDRSEKRERSARYTTPESSSDSDARPSRGRDSRRDSEDRYSEQYSAAKEYIHAPRRFDPFDTETLRRQTEINTRRAHEQLAEAKEYMSRERPPISRTTSKTGSYYSDSKGRISGHVRRSSAKPKDRERERERDRIVEAPEESSRDRRPPPMPHATSSPAALKIPQDSPKRHAYSQSRDEPPIANFRRSSTMDSRPEPTRSRGRTREEDSGYSSPGTPETHQSQFSTRPQPYPTAPHPTSSKTRYAAPTVGTVPEEYDLGRGSRNPRIVERMPAGVRFTQSPEPISRVPHSDEYVSKSRGTYPIPTVNIQTATPGMPRTTTTTYSYADPSSSRPPIPHTTSYTTAVPRSGDYDRGRSSDRLFGEVPPKTSSYSREEIRRPGPERRTSYRPEEVSKSKRYGMEDVHFSDKSAYRAGYEAAKKELLREQKERYDRPTPGLSRASTNVY